MLTIADIKSHLVGMCIKDVGLTNVSGVRHARIVLDGVTDPLMVRLDDVMLTLSSLRKPVSRAVHAGYDKVNSSASSSVASR